MKLKATGTGTAGSSPPLSGRVQDFLKKARGDTIEPERSAMSAAMPVRAEAATSPAGRARQRQSSLRQQPLPALDVTAAPAMEGDATPAEGAASSPPPPAGFRHLPREVAQRLKSFMAGKDEKPPIAAASPPTRATDTSSLPRSPIDGGEIWVAIDASRRSFRATGIFSLAINLLMLVGPLFMLQVYDRVLTSGSLPTLVALSALTALLYGVIGALEFVRSRIIVRIGIELDRRIGDRVFQASLRRSLVAPGASVPALRELDNLRNFIAGPGPITFFDAPWTPVYLLVIFFLHWWLGIAATLGALLLLLIAWASEVRSRGPLMEASKAAARSIELAETGQRNAEAITAMGMLTAYRSRWQDANRQALAWQVHAADRLGALSSASKVLRLLMQSLMLALGAALAITGDISAGAIVAGTIIFGRALAPVEQAVSQWRSFVKARESLEKIGELLRQHPEPAERMSLPAPRGQLHVQNLRVAAPDSRTLILSGVTFTLEPGNMLAVIGPSASGKSTLARTLVGLWDPFGGQIRLDGARLDQWNAEELGRHIGYLPQNVELFAGSVRENISRFLDDASDKDVVAAAKAAHAHDMIMALPQSYETQLGAFGTYLSAGQRQRIGLARALFGTPALVVLDEPNANLDRLGDEALAAACDGMRARGQAVVLISHRVQAIGKADYLLYLEQGTQRAFGPRADVLRMLQAGATSNEAPAPSQATTGRSTP